jgi:hypothetical protein
MYFKIAQVTLRVLARVESPLLRMTADIVSEEGQEILASAPLLFLTTFLV